VIAGGIDDGEIVRLPASKRHKQVADGAALPGASFGDRPPSRDSVTRRREIESQAADLRTIPRWGRLPA